MFDRVGQLLAQERERRGWSLADVERRRGPDAATVVAHEKGRIRTFEALRRHCQVFRWRVPDLLWRVLSDDDDRPTLTPSLLALFAAYHELSPEAQRALEVVADLLKPRTTSLDAVMPLAPRRRTGRSGPSIVNAVKKRA